MISPCLRSLFSVSLLGAVYLSRMPGSAVDGCDHMVPEVRTRLCILIKHFHGDVVVVRTVLDFTMATCSADAAEVISANETRNSLDVLLVAEIALQEAVWVPWVEKSAKVPEASEVVRILLALLSFRHRAIRDGDTILVSSRFDEL